MSLITILLMSLAFVSSAWAQKQVYIPLFITREGMDLNNPESQWCYCRSMETENFVVFWEPGFGSNPSIASGSYQVNMTSLLEVAEKSYAYMIESLGFAVRGQSVTDRYKMMIFLLYSTEWAAYGSGQDNLVGTLHVNPAAARSNTVLAHEIGHCFQYITGCDTNGGYQYGFGPNQSGGNGFWEQCAQWMSFKVYPGSQFSDGYFREYLTSSYLHIIHETPRYANYFIQDYWAFKRGKDYVGRLWRESRSPEDPVETYKRISGISQQQFNDEIYEHAARLTTWDLPEILSLGQPHINSRVQVAMTNNNGFWRVNPAVCIENYGYNSIKLNAPSEATEVTVRFQGLAGTSGYRALNVDQGGWRFGFVALLENGTRVYSDMGTAEVSGGGTNPDRTLSFNCPDKCVGLWLVVSGAPKSHWRHAWDDDNTNDEHWPYQVQFVNTDLLGVFTNPIHDVTLTYNLTMDPMSAYTATPVALNTSRISQAFAMAPDNIARVLGNSVIYNAINPDGSLDPNSTAIHPGHWYNRSGAVINWGNEAYVYSELNLNTFTANIGQYPDRCQPGDVFTIRQALAYTQSPGNTARVTLVFNIRIKSDQPDCAGVPGGSAYPDVCGQCAGGSTGIAPVTDPRNCLITSVIQPENSGVSLYPNPTKGALYLDKEENWILLDMLGTELLRGSGTTISLDSFNPGVYLVKINNQIHKAIKE